MKPRVVQVPVLDTGIGKAAGYKDDKDLIEAYERQRRLLETILTPEALARYDALDRSEATDFVNGTKKNS